jgi:hypothetical protein
MNIRNYTSKVAAGESVKKMEAILLDQVQPLQVFLAYQYDEQTGRTFYESVAAGSVKLLGA